MEFLKDLAAKNDFECFVDSTSSDGRIKGYFQKPSIDESVQTSLYLHFGRQTNLLWLDISLDAIRPMSSELEQKNASSAETLSSSSEKSDLTSLGKT